MGIHTEQFTPNRSLESGLAVLEGLVLEGLGDIPHPGLFDAQQVPGEGAAKIRGQWLFNFLGGIGIIPEDDKSGTETPTSGPRRSR